MKYLVIGTRLFKPDILRNTKRSQLNECILENPGIHERELRDTFHLGSNEAIIHLSFLSKFGFIRKKKYKNRNVYFPIDFDEAQELKILLLRNETAKQIYNAIDFKDKIRLSEISNVLNIPYTTIQYHLTDLIDGGLVQKIKENGTVFYSLASVLPPIQTEEVEVKREFDYVGGNIRFKVAVRNFSNMTINNVGVNLSHSEQFLIDPPQHIIANLPPNSTRGVDFQLTPLTCGQSKVFGSVIYEDAYGNVNTLTIEPKEISIKCPLVQPQAVTQEEVNRWIQNLKKGTSTINYHSISDSEAFRIGMEQVNALDLNEIQINGNEKWGLYSGLIKVTGKYMVAKVSIDNPNIVLDVWTNEMNQTTGFLAYITNLINIALETSYKMIEKTKDLTQKVSNLMTTFGLIDETFVICQKIPPAQEITNRLSTIQEIFQNNFPDSGLIQEFKIWNAKILNMFEPNHLIETSMATDLQHNIIDWMFKIQELIQSHMKIYQETFNNLNHIVNEFSKGFDTLNGRITEHVKTYGLGILSYLLILEKKSGITIFQKNLGELQINPDLIGGFLHALQSFGLELSASESSMKALSYEKYQFQIETGDHIRVALIIRGKPNQYLISKLSEFVKEFELVFKNELFTFSGNMESFKTASELFDSIFQ